MVAERLIKMRSCISNQIPQPKQHIRIDSCQENQLRWLVNARIIAFPLGRGGGEGNWWVGVAINKWILRLTAVKRQKVKHFKAIKVVTFTVKSSCSILFIHCSLPNSWVESFLEQLFELLSTSVPFVDYFGKNVKIVPSTNSFISLPMFSSHGKRIVLSNIKLIAWDVWTRWGILIAFLLRGFFTAVNLLTRRFSSRVWFNAGISVNIG